MTVQRGPTVAGGGRAQKTASQKPGSQRSAGDVSRLVVPFEDNRQLSQVLGEYDAHLALLEDRLGIEANVHGNVVVLNGSSASCGIARQVLETLYARAGKGEEITAADVDSLVRHGSEEKPSRTSSSDGRAEIATRKRLIRARTPTQSEYIRQIDTVDLVFGIGPAGTGKTYLAVVAAARALEQGHVERIILSRPAVEAGERLGFLPGDLKEKVDPYLRPLYDALYDVLPPEKVQRDIENGIIEIAPLAFMRGRTLAHSFVILDEAQNTTQMQMKMFLTRLGEGSKMVITGDPTQIDLPPGQSSGLNEAVAILKDVEGIGITQFKSSDVVRRDLVGRIVQAYDKLTAATGKSGGQPQNPASTAKPSPPHGSAKTSK